MSNTLNDFSKLCIHTITTKPWALEEAVENYSKAGVSGITVWRQALEGRDVRKSGHMIREAGLKIISLCRGGFFSAKDSTGRQTAINDNLKAIDEAAELGAPHIVLVCGAVPGQSLNTSRQQIQEGIEKILPHAQACNVKLAIEPLHPMYADDRSAINTIKQANDMCDAINSPFVGVAVDVYHLWWDPDLEQEISRCGRNGNLMAFHICDWRTPTDDLLNDRGLMGEGCIPIKEIRGWVEKTGFDGFNEVEIFSTKWWAMDQEIFLKDIQKAYLQNS